MRDLVLKGRLLPLPVDPYIPGLASSRLRRLNAYSPTLPIPDAIDPTIWPFFGNEVEAELLANDTCEKTAN